MFELQDKKTESNFWSYASDGFDLPRNRVYKRPAHLNLINPVMKGMYKSNILFEFTSNGHIWTVTCYSTKNPENMIRIHIFFVATL